MRKSPAKPPTAENPLTRLLRRALEQEDDPALRRWLERLLAGDSASGPLKTCQSGKGVEEK